MKAIVIFYKTILIVGLGCANIHPLAMDSKVSNKVEDRYVTICSRVYTPGLRQ